VKEGAHHWKHNVSFIDVVNSFSHKGMMMGIVDIRKERIHGMI